MMTRVGRRTDGPHCTRPDSPGVVRVGLLGRSGAGACPNLPQRRPAAGSAARRSAEYQRFSSRAPARSGPLQQIWTNGVAMDPGMGGAGRGDDRDRPAPRREVHFALENDGWNCMFECEVHVSASRGVQGAVVATRAAHPGIHGGAVCPNLLQRPRSRRSAGGESLVFRGSYRGRSRSGAPLQQIWTRPRPGPPQESHQHRPGRVRPRTTRTTGSRPCGAPPAPL